MSLLYSLTSGAYRYIKSSMRSSSRIPGTNPANSVGTYSPSISSEGIFSPLPLSTVNPLLDALNPSDRSEYRVEFLPSPPKIVSPENILSKICRRLLHSRKYWDVGGRLKNTPYLLWLPRGSFAKNCADSLAR